MRRFNVDEFIWFIIQLCLITLMIYLLYSGNITYFINDEMVIYFYISIFIMILFSISQLSNVFTIKSRKEITNKFIPITAILVLSGVLLFVLPTYKLIKHSTINDKLSFHAEDTLVISNNNYTVLKDIEFLESYYNGQNLELIGKVYGQLYDDNEIILVREEISCCQSDKELIKIRLKGIDASFEKGDWIKVIGEIKYDNHWYLEIKDYKITDEPEDIYFHKEL